MSHLDYSNSLYNGLPAVTIDKLQITQNLAAKVILNLPKFASATTAMFKLHWLPIRQRIKYKAGHHCLQIPEHKLQGPQLPGWSPNPVTKTDEES